MHSSSHVVFALVQGLLQAPCEQAPCKPRRTWCRVMNRKKHAICYATHARTVQLVLIRCTAQQRPARHHVSAHCLCGSAER